MAKKKIEVKREHLDILLNDLHTITYSDQLRKKDLEEDVDDSVKKLYKSIFEDDKVLGKKTGNKLIDNSFPSWHGESGHGKPDIMIYNYFGNEEISLLIENKNFTSTDNATAQAISYASVGNIIKKPIRVIIGNSPSQKLDVRVLVKDKYEELKINGVIINQFIGKEILNLIYDNPNINEFVIVELVEKKFAQKDFHNIIYKLKNIYRQLPEIQNNDDLSINFTVSFIALKMIMEKQSLKWDSLKNPDDIKKQIDNIVGKKADKLIKDKYKDIFIIMNKDNNETFNFYNLIDNIDARENEDGIKPSESVLIAIHELLKEIPERDLAIDLFGEVYECLASKKTKSLLGEYFTRRHIIQAIVRMFLTDDDIQNIVEYKKTIGDPACGTGGFLTESFKYIKEYCEKEKPELDITDLASKIIIGYDINANNIGRTRINMTLAGDGFSDINRCNSLTSTEIKNDIDYILTNVPYGKGDYAISDANSDDEFLKTNNNKRLELNFVIKVIEMLKKGGKASIIVPEGLLEAPTLASFREYLFKQCKITTIISLPKFAFAPYTKWKTYVIFIEKRQTALKNIEDVIKKNEKIWAYIVDNDGYANSDKRFPTTLTDENGAWLHDELQTYIDYDGIKHSSKIEQAFEANLEDEKNVYLNEWNKEIKGKKFGFITFNEIMQKKTIKYKTLTAKEVNHKLKLEAEKQSILDDENHQILISYISKNKNGYIKKDDYISKDELKEDFVSIFEDMQIEYDSENNKFYDLSVEEITYALPLVPEKYFRKKEVREITLEQLTFEIDKASKDLESILGNK